MNMRNILLFATFLICIVLPAQRNGGKSSPAKAKRETVSPETIRKYIDDYAFDKALQALSGSDDETSALIRQAELGVSMLQGVRRVDFLDSIVVDKSVFLEAIRLSEGSGRLSLTDSLVTYINDFGDVRIVCRPDSLNRLVLTREHKVGAKWHAAADAAGEHDFETQNFPYLMPDGQTLYFAERGDESLGGYDIFVTRYDVASKQFLRAENIGMPFNSPANDYMYVVDEQANLGWFVTDRRQPEGKVCIYVFRPSDTYETLSDADDNPESAVTIARIPAFTSDRSYRDVLPAMQHKPSLFIVIDNATVYTDLSQFRSPTARRIAAEWLTRRDELEKNRKSLDDMRRNYRKQPALRDSILEAEQNVHQLEATVHTLEKNMREAEIK